MVVPGVLGVPQAQLALPTLVAEVVLLILQMTLVAGVAVLQDQIAMEITPRIQTEPAQAL
jgi:tetrahydromethanopterin S-methyltransferase subunit C